MRKDGKMAQKQSTEDKEWQEGMEQHFDKGGGDYECGNCDWATNDRDKALRHKELYGHKFWMSLATAIAGEKHDGK